MRMIPGKVRQEGKVLYQDDRVRFQDYQDGLLQFQVATEEVHLSAVGGQDYCSCQDFSKEGYCAHLAAVEIFIREEEDGRTSVESSVPLEAEPRGERFPDFHKNGENFFSFFLKDRKELDQLHLEVEGSLPRYRPVIQWTFKLRYGESKAYIVRDISDLLTRLEYGAELRLGRQIQIENLSWELFDSASQNVLSFLLNLKQEASVISNPFFSHYGRYLSLPLPLLQQAFPLFQELEHFSVDFDEGVQRHPGFQPLTEEQSPYFLKLLEAKGGYELFFEIKEHFSFYEGQLLYFQDTFFQISYGQARLLNKLHFYFETIVMEPLVFGTNQLSRLFTFLEMVKGVVNLWAPEGLEPQAFAITLHLDVDPQGWIQTQSTYQIDDQIFTDEHQLASSGLILSYQQQLDYELALQEADFPSTMVGRRPPFTEVEIVDFFDYHLPKLQELADVILSPAFTELRQEVDLELSIEEGQGFLEVSFSLEGVDSADIQEAIQVLSTGNLYRTKTGRYLSLAATKQEQLQQLMSVEDGIWNQEEGHFQVKRQLLGRVNAALHGASVSYSEALEELLEHLVDPGSYPLPSHPIVEQLRDYQRLGVAWMSMLAHYGFGGILADDMGLGKTLQAISFLVLNLKVGEKSLIVAPSGLLYNWKAELERFAPDLTVGMVYGSKKEREEVRGKDYQVYLTSYGSLRQDISDYQNEHFQSLILDEAQYLKNQRTKVHASLQKIDAESIFALSGTPVENRLEEIGSIFGIVLPGLLPAKKLLLKMPVEAVAHQIRPFILRRDKQTILTELPEKTEDIYVTELLPEQKALYVAQREQMQQELQGLTEQEFRKRKVEFLAGLTRLRQICDSPALFLEDYQGQSGKLELLKILLAGAKESGQRILIFSQFVEMLTLVEPILDKAKVDYFTIKGSTPARKRQEISQAFNQGQGDVVLISLKAGGVGLNLTGADTVFLLDLWWNPAVEEQAIGRAHRMGQQNPVQVYRFITKGSIEEKIFELQEHKRNLLGSILDAGRPNESFGLDEVKEILGI
ncbi:DEAD/DEAH box helicase [Streptococcus danieliae]|uniref:DEAD/DEAH box helicase n=1 Tax=Streptococcus danieliae TaxID=747656 RepID=UPI0021C93BEC|nr:DEAD/DEAH box helicase [Streptococcus danieliae]MCU0081728.1 SNF2 family helicase [Streptococcus danieliae]